MNTKIAVSLLASDFGRLNEEIRKAENSGSDWIHFDVMDGVFVPNISFGEPVLECVRKLTKLPIDVHLMITDPIRYIDNYARLGADVITFHYEAAENPMAVIEKIHSHGKLAGIAVKPATPVSEIEQYIDCVDMVLIMTVEPGFGGQSFIPETLDKVRQVSKIAKNRDLDLLIQTDGGINGATAPKVLECGGNVLVSGSYLFKASDMAEAVKSIR